MEEEVLAEPDGPDQPNRSKPYRKRTEADETSWSDEVDTSIQEPPRQGLREVVDGQLYFNHAIICTNFGPIFFV